MSEEWSVIRQLLWHVSCDHVQVSVMHDWDLLICTWKPQFIYKKKVKKYIISDWTVNTHTHIIIDIQRFTIVFPNVEHLELTYIVSNKNVTCDRQSDSRWTSICPTLLVCYEPELVLSWVALSQVCDSQSAVLLITTVLHTTWILWVCSQIHRFVILHFSKPECFLCSNCIITVICSGWVSVDAAYFHCWSF